MSARLFACQVEVAMQGIENDHGEFCAPFVHLGFCPTAIQTDGIWQILRESQAIFALALEDVANFATCSQIEDSSAGSSTIVHESQEHLAVFSETGAIIPGLVGL